MKQSLLIKKHTIRLGGMRLVIRIWLDDLFNENKSSMMIYQIEKNASVSRYPSILEDLYYLIKGKECNLISPKSFGEKMQQIKLSCDDELHNKLSDKYEVREWVKEKIGDKYLIPLIGVWNNFNEIVFERLPEKFVLKANHGSGWNIVVKNKNNFNYDAAKTKFDEWMNLNFAFIDGLELQYKNIVPRIIAEQYIEEFDGDLKDYKIHCFNGEPKMIQVLGNRKIEEHTATEAFFDTKWKRLDNLSTSRIFLKYDNSPKKPDNLDELLKIAKILSKDIYYVRVDLYDINGVIKFGEMTFTPSSGYASWCDIIPLEWWNANRR